MTLPQQYKVGSTFKQISVIFYINRTKEKNGHLNKYKKTIIRQTSKFIHDEKSEN